MPEDTVIKIDGLYKKFTRSLKRSLVYGSVDVVKNMLGIAYDSGVLRKGEFWSLQDVSLQLKRGEAIGIIGENGSGKTTLLRLINGIFPPDKGSVMVRGRMGALIAVGAGFHPHMTGRENIMLNGTILGMKRHEIEAKFDDIIKFADIGEFIDAPVSTYSSGMTVRLGFSIAIHSNPDILLADEILAVGDLAFMLKCYRKISEFRENGGSLILVSHNIQLIRNTCSHLLWMEKGQVRAYGPSQAVADEYEKFVLAKDAATNESAQGNIINTDPQVHISGVEFLDANGKPVTEFKQTEKFTARISYDTQRKVNKPIFTLTLSNAENINVISNYSGFDGYKVDSIDGKGYVDFTINELMLKPAQYFCNLTLTENDDVSNNLDWHEKAYSFVVIPNGNVSYGLINPFPKWEFSNTHD